MRKHLFRILSLLTLFVLAPPVHGQSTTPLRVTQGATTVYPTYRLDFSSGCTVTGTGTTASIACTGGGGALVVDAPLTGAGTSGSHLRLSYGTGLTLSGGLLVVDQGFSPTWTGSHTFARALTLSTSNAGIVGSASATIASPRFGVLPGTGLTYLSATTGVNGAAWGFIAQAGGAASAGSSGGLGGPIVLEAGAGGGATVTAGAGDAGPAVVAGGAGGSGTTAEAAGAGGDVTATAGPGGVDNGGGGSSGGVASLIGGAGSAAGLHPGAGNTGGVARVVGGQGGAGGPATTAGRGGTVRLTSGDGGTNGGGGGGSSGDVIIDAGTATGVAAAGTVTVGAARAITVAIGRSGTTSTVAGGLSVAADVSARHYIGSGGTPSIAVGAGAGAGGGCAISGTDTAGVITVTAPGLGVESDPICVVTFATAFAAAPVVLIGPANRVAFTLNAVGGDANWYYDQADVTTTQFDFRAGAGFGGALGAFVFNYIVIGK